MSVQIFLQGKLLGIDEFLFAPAGENPRSGLPGPLALDQPAERSSAARAAGRAGSGQNPAGIERRRAVPVGAAGGIARGARKRFSRRPPRKSRALSDGVAEAALERHRKSGRLERRAPAAHGADGPSPRHARGFEGCALERPPDGGDAEEYFADQLGMKLRDAESAGWSPETSGTHSDRRRETRLEPGRIAAESLPFARHAAPSDDGRGAGFHRDARRARRGTAYLGRAARRRR